MCVNTVKFVPAKKMWAGWFLFSHEACMMLEATMKIQKTLKAKQQMHIMFGNILQLQITLQQKRADPRMLFALFARNPSVAAALPEPLHISWRVPSWAKTKQEYSHVLQSTKRMMTGVQL